jgi:hypothetical protein
MDALVTPILEGLAPKSVKLAAARGALPLPRATLVRLYVVLRQDEDEQIRTQAEASLADLDRPALLEVLSEETCAPEVLSHFADRAARDEELAERIAFHPGVPGPALDKLASAGSGNVIELVLTNQERLLTQPSLLDRLSRNPALRADQRGRILELLERAVRAHERGESQAGSDDTAEPDVNELARLLEVDVGDLFAASEIMDGDEFRDSEDPVIRTVYARILTLNTAQKAILAMRGGREERMILVRDSNQVVALAVLKNGRLKEDDVESICRMRSVHAEVLRQIAMNRDWCKAYAVAHALVRNPRTPQGVATNLVSRLHNHDLKMVVGNHDIPDLIRRMAKRMLDMRQNKGAASFKKKH